MDVALSNLEPGDVSSIIVDDQGTHVFRLVEKTAARELRFEDVQGAVTKELTAIRQDERLNEFLAQKRNALGVVIEEDRLRTLPWPNPSHEQGPPPTSPQLLQRLHPAE